MSTGPEHYEQAEDALVDAERARYAGDDVATERHLQFAQVHATLALAAATAQAMRPKLVTPEAQEWTEVLS